MRQRSRQAVRGIAMPEDTTSSDRRRLAGSPGGGKPVRENKLLGLLPPQELARIKPHVELADFTFRQSIYKDGQPNDYAYFPHTGVFSIVALPGVEEEPVVEVATVGNEGMIGLPLLLGGDVTRG